MPDPHAEVRLEISPRHRVIVVADSHDAAEAFRRRHELPTVHLLYVGRPEDLYRTRGIPGDQLWIAVIPGAAAVNHDITTVLAHLRSLGARDVPADVTLALLPEAGG